MAIQIDLTEAGDYVFEENGVSDDNTSAVTKDGAPFTTFAHPTDNLLIQPNVVGVNLFLDFLDPFPGAVVRVGSLGDPNGRPDNVAVGALEASSVILFVNGQINEWGADAGPDIAAVGVQMEAGAGIGVSGALEIAAPSFLRATTVTGGIDLRVHSATVLGGPGVAVANFGNVKLEVFGSIQSSVSSGPSVKAGNNNGNVVLKALGGDSFISSPNGFDLAVAPSGQVLVEVGQDLLLGTLTYGGNDIRADDSVRLVAGRDVILDGDSDVISDAFLNATGEDVTVIAGRDIRVENATGDGAGMQSGGDVRLTTGLGGRLTLQSPSASAIQAAGDVIVEADRFICSASSGITALGAITLRPRTEGRAIVIGSATDTAAALELSAVEVGRLDGANLTIGSDVAGAVRVTDAIVANAGSLTLSSGSEVRVGASVAADHLILRSGRDIVIAAGAAFGAGSVAGYVDHDGSDGGQGGRVTVHAALTKAFVFTGAADGDLLQGAAAADTLDGGGGADTLDGRAGADSLIGGDGGDTYVVTAGDLVAETGSGGVDTVSSAADWTLGANLENLTLTGAADASGAGNEADNRINGNVGTNLLTGWEGNDTLSGFAEADTLNGGGGADQLTGGGDADLLAGGGKNDNLQGGAGADRFRFDTTPHSAKNNDVISDFVVADDTVVLENAVFAALTTPGVMSGNQFRSGPAAVDGNDFIIHDPATGAIFYDADGSGAAAAIQFASVTAGLVLTRFDFIVT